MGESEESNYNRILSKYLALSLKTKQIFNSKRLLFFLISDKLQNKTAVWVSEPLLSFEMSLTSFSS